MASASHKPRRKPSTILDLFRNLTTTASSPVAAADENNGHAVQMGTDLDEAKLSVSGGPPQLEQLLPQLQLDRPISERILAAKEIAAILDQYRLSDVLAIWSAASDLPSNESTEASYAGFNLLVSCVKSPSLSLAERATFSKAIYESGGNEHLDLRFQALLELTDNGRNVEGLEERLTFFLSWLLEVSFKIAPKARKKEKKERMDLAEPGETLLGRLFQFTVDVIKFNSAVLRDDDFAMILDQIISICQKTTNKSDIISSMNVMAALVTYTNIKPSAFRPCLELLCDVHRQLGKLREQTWSTLELVFGSHLRCSAISDLIAVLHVGESSRPESKIVRGAFNVLSVLVRKNGTGGLPHISLGVLVESANTSIRHSNDPKLEIDVLNFYNSVLADPELQNRLLEGVDWDHFTGSLLKCAYGLDVIPPEDALTLVTNSDVDFSKKQNDVDRGEAHKLFNEVIQQLSSIFLSLDIIKQDQTVIFFIALGGALNDGAAETLAAFASTKPLTTPSAKDFEATCRHFTVHFVHDKARPQRLRKCMVKLLRNSFDTIQYVSTELVNAFTTDLLQNLGLEEDPVVLEELCLFAREALRSTKRTELFHPVWSLLTTAVLQMRSSPDQTSLRPDLITTTPPAPSSTLQQPSLCRIIVGHIVSLFFEAMTDDTKHADLLFDFILEVAGNSSLETDARICALRLLFRIRSRGRLDIYVIQESDSQSMAAVLCRTHDTAILLPPADSAGSLIEYRNSSSGSVSAAIARSKPPIVQRPRPPLWLFPGPQDLTHDIISHFLCSDTPINVVPGVESSVLKVTHWLETVISILQQPSVDWDIYSYVLVHLGAQLKNQSLFTTAMPQIQLLRSVICDQIRAESFHTPPSYTSLRKADVAICLFHTLTMLVSYNACFAKSEEDEIIRSFMLGIGSWDRTSKWCIHGLSVCCHELPLSASKSLDTIIQKMSQIITQPQIAIHILEFLCSLARLPELYKNFREDEYKVVFGVSFRYLQYVRDQKEKEEESKQLSAPNKIPKRNSDSVREIKGPTDYDMRPKPRSSPEELPQYVYALAFHVITFWYMALKLRDRPTYMPWIANNLTYIDRSGNEVIEDQGVVTMDMMERLAHSDRDETCYSYDFARPTDGEVSKKTWIIGLSLLTIQTAGRTGLSQLTRRRPSGTKYSIYQPALTSPPRHQVPLTTGIDADAFYTSAYIGVLPEDILQDQYSCISLAALPSPVSEMPIPLPQDETLERTMNSFDRNSTVDGHRIGVIYIREGQTEEVEILANTSGSRDYEDFLARLGTLIRLKGATFNTQGLDRSDDSDGLYAYCWRDRATEIVFHITTMMPTDLENQPMCVNKKQHIGNDFVNIIWNDSSEPFKFNTFPSAFNYVYIVITPDADADFVALRKSRNNGTQSTNGATNTTPSLPTKDFSYKVQVLSAPGFPSISPAAEPKIVGSKSLAPFVRLLALNASFFSLVWRNREVGEHYSPWRNRLREIKRLRDKYAIRASNFRGASPQSLGLSGLQSPGNQTGKNSQRASLAFGGGGGVEKDGA